MHTDLLRLLSSSLIVVAAGVSPATPSLAADTAASTEKSPLQRNSVPEFRRCEVTLTPYGFVMKNSNFRIVPLATEVAASARRMAASGAPDHAMVVANSPDG